MIQCPFCNGRGYNTSARTLCGQMVTVVNPCLVCSERMSSDSK